VDSETTEIQNGWETLIFNLNTNKPKVNSNFRCDVVDKAPIVFGKMFVNAIVFKIFPEDVISDKTSRHEYHDCGCQELRNDMSEIQ
jgi:hypothetical protein